MEMSSYFSSIKDRIGSTLRLFLSEKRPDLARINPLGPDLADRLLDFSLQGKMIRGCLVPLGYALSTAGGSSEKAPRSAIETGAAMELLQSGLLVHDDIMDRDLTRRGKATIFQQYAEAAEREGHGDPSHVGEALGICAGDVAFFLAFELLARMEVDPAVARNLLGLCARELTAVGVAQMQDVAWGASPAMVKDEDILRLYTYKTGRYTFSLPLMAGGLLAGAASALMLQLEELGEHLGVAFQIRDDELGLFGNERELGKPVGSDIREGKKTLYYSFVMASATPEERARLAQVFGNRESSEADIAYVRDVAVARGVKARVDSMARDLETRARSLAGRISGGGTRDREALASLLDYTMARRR